MTIGKITTNLVFDNNRVLMVELVKSKNTNRTALDIINTVMRGTIFQSMDLSQGLIIGFDMPVNVGRLRRDGSMHVLSSILRRIKSAGYVDILKKVLVRLDTNYFTLETSSKWIQYECIPLALDEVHDFNNYTLAPIEDSSFLDTEMWNDMYKSADGNIRKITGYDSTSTINNHLISCYRELEDAVALIALKSKIYDGGKFILDDYIEVGNMIVRTSMMVNTSNVLDFKYSLIVSDTRGCIGNVFVGKEFMFNNKEDMTIGLMGYVNHNDIDAMIVL